MHNPDGKRSFEPKEIHFLWRSTICWNTRVWSFAFCRRHLGKTDAEGGQSILTGPGRDGSVAQRALQTCRTGDAPVSDAAQRHGRECLHCTDLLGRLFDGVGLCRP